MDASEFSKELDKALSLCRAAAELKLPIEEMLEHVEDAIEAVPGGLPGTLAAETGPQDPRLPELEALREILSAVADVAAIGSSLPPTAPDLTALPCPLPANLRK